MEIFLTYQEVMEELAVYAEEIRHTYMTTRLCGQNIKIKMENGLGNGRVIIVEEKEKDINLKNSNVGYVEVTILTFNQMVNIYG